MLSVGRTQTFLTLNTVVYIYIYTYKTILLQAWRGRVDSGRLRLPDCKTIDTRSCQVRLSARRTGRLYSPGNTPGTHFSCGPGSSAGIATDYGLDGPGSNPSADEIFRPSRPALGPTQNPAKWVPGLSRG